MAGKIQAIETIQDHDYIWWWKFMSLIKAVMHCSGNYFLQESELPGCTLDFLFLILANLHWRVKTFNVPDGCANAQGLFRKVLFGELPPFRLVRLSNESLGSRELARWHDSELVKVCVCVFTFCSWSLVILSWLLWPSLFLWFTDFDKSSCILWN